MSHGDLPPLIRDLLYAGDNHLLDDDVGQAMARIVSCGVDDGFAAGEIQGRVRKHRIAQAFAGPFPLPRLHHGDLVLGIDQRRNPIRIPIQHLNAHSLTLGGSGSGKTTKSRFLILQIAPQVRGVWLFDLRKREFAMLRTPLAGLGVDLTVLRARDLRLNPLQIPEAVSPVDWATRAADMMVQVLRLPPRATKLLHAVILKLYRTHGILDGGQIYPTLFDLRKAITEDRTANPPAKQAILDSLEPTLMSLVEVLRHSHGWSTHDLAQRHLVFELGGLAEVDKDLILNTLILGEFNSRVARGISNPQMDLWICLDEAQRLISSSSVSGGVVDLLGLVRGTGVGLDLSVQSADVASSILSNTAMKFLGRCGSATDYDTVGAAMGLTTEQRRWMSLHLKPGLFVGQAGEGDWRRPFLVQIPPLDLSLPVPSPVEAPSSAGGGRLLLGMEEGNDSTEESPAVPPSEPAEVADHSGPSEADLRYLRAVVDHPGQPSSTYPRLAKIGSNQAHAIRRRLVALGFLREHHVNTGRRGRASIVLEPLEPAHRALRESDDDREGGDR